jgi:hypothetical protein
MAKVELKTREEALRCLSKAFEDYRRSSGKQRCHFPESLKSLARDAALTDLSISAIASACRVKPQSVRNWIQSSPPSARRVAVVAEDKESSNRNSFHFNSNQSQDSRFIFRLNRGLTLDTSANQALWLIERLGGQN